VCIEGEYKPDDNQYRCERADLPTRCVCPVAVEAEQVEVDISMA
jgi:hypothetical protein